MVSCLFNPHVIGDIQQYSMLNSVSYTADSADAAPGRPLEQSSRRAVDHRTTGTRLGRRAVFAPLDKTNEHAIHTAANEIVLWDTCVRSRVLRPLSAMAVGFPRETQEVDIPLSSGCIHALQHRRTTTGDVPSKGRRDEVQLVPVERI